MTITMEGSLHGPPPFDMPAFKEKLERRLDMKSEHFKVKKVQCRNQAHAHEVRSADGFSEAWAGGPDSTVALSSAVVSSRVTRSSRGARRRARCGSAPKRRVASSSSCSVWPSVGWLGSRASACRAQRGAAASAA